MTTAFRTAFAWHRPLTAVAAANAVLIPIGIVGILVDPRIVTGAPVWLKPTKFAVSIAIYGVTWAWLYAQVRTRANGRLRGVHAAGTLAGLLLGIEMVIIILQAARGTTSHYNNVTPFDSTLWTIMGASIALLWFGTLYLAAALFRVRDGDRARLLAVRAGSVLALTGMFLGFLMTSLPSQHPLADAGIVGAHSVGVLDGGPGLPLVGWSTVGGDLRIPHFVGMHALQAIPLVLLALELLGPRMPALRSAGVRFRLVAVVTGAFGAVLALLTWQALRGQSIVAPDASTAGTFAAIALLTVACAAWAVRRPSGTPDAPPLRTPEGAPS